MKEKDAKTHFCPLINNLCKGDKCMAWQRNQYQEGAEANGSCNLVTNIHYVET